VLLIGTTAWTFPVLLLQSLLEKILKMIDYIYFIFYSISGFFFSAKTSLQHGAPMEAAGRRADNALRGL